MAREWISTLFQKAPELTEEQEKLLHQPGRKVRKRFGMKPAAPTQRCCLKVVDGKIVESWGYWPDKEIEGKMLGQ